MGGHYNSPSYGGALERDTYGQYGRGIGSGLADRSKNHTITYSAFNVATNTLNFHEVEAPTEQLPFYGPLDPSNKPQSRAGRTGSFG